MRICHVVASLDERSGGPSKSVYALCRALGRLGHAVDLCTLDPDPATAGTRQDGKLRVCTFLRGRPHLLARSTRLDDHLKQSRYDVIQNHALWLRPLHYAHIYATARQVPLVNSPRGMMSPWAWFHHRSRKRLARHLIHPGALEATTGWHATSAEEAADIRTLGFSQPICVAPNGVERPDPEQTVAALTHWREVCPAVGTRRTAVFYSRFHRKKRVLELIDLWLERAPSDWILLMAGVPEDYTTRQLETYVLRASGGGRVHVFDGLGVPPPYAVASLFLLPSHSENFGMVIAEAMSHGVPVLVTDATPWTGVNAREIGWCVSWEDYGDVLVSALHQSPAALAARGAAAREWVFEQFCWDKSARKLEAFYIELGAKPLNEARCAVHEP